MRPPNLEGRATRDHKLTQQPAALPEDFPAVEETVAVSRKVTAKASELETELKQELWRRWQRGEMISVEECLDQYPALANNPDLLLELIQVEVRLHREGGANPQLSEYLERFPDHHEALRRLFEPNPVHASRPDQAAVGSTVEASDASLWDSGTLAPIQARKESAAEMRPTASLAPDGDNRDGPDFSNRPDLIAFLAPPQAADEKGRLGPYRVLRVLGLGAMGVVYRAEDPNLHRLVALKAMLPVLAGNPASRERFLREAQAAAKVEHDNVVTIYQVGEDRGIPFLAMPLLKGETLEERLNREEKLSLREVVRIGCEMAEGLQAAHEQGLVHRDVKPSNVWLEETRGRVKLLDFGLARETSGSAQLTLKGDIVGTPYYMAPEQGMGQEVDRRCDLFSLGCVLYRALTGQVPFTGTNPLAVMVAAATQDPVPLEQLNPQVPPPLVKLVRRLLARDRQKRPDSAREVADALRTLAEMQKRPWRIGQRMGWAAVLFLSASVAVLAYLQFPSLPGSNELREIVHNTLKSILPPTTLEREVEREVRPIPTPAPQPVPQPIVSSKAPTTKKSPEPAPAPKPPPSPPPLPPTPKPEQPIEIGPPPPPVAILSKEAKEAYRRGMSLLLGIGATIDEAQAVQCFIDAETKGHPYAKGQRALCHRWGIGVKEDRKEAKQLADGVLVEVQEAAKQHDPDAQATLGSFYFLGLGVKQDYGEAAKWYRKADDQGNTIAMTMLGLMYESGNEVQKKDVKAAVGWYLKAALRGNAWAMNLLGTMCAEGQGIKQDKVEAFNWYRQAADKGHTLAMINLGTMYANGDGIDQDYAEAVHWFGQAAKKGNAQAMYYLGRMYETGSGVPEKNREEAIRLYREAAKKGIELARERLKKLESAETPPEKK